VKRKTEPTPSSLHPDGAAVRLHDAFHDREAEADAVTAGAAGLPEAVEYVRMCSAGIPGPLSFTEKPFRHYAAAR
jgi:hypothetical protein